MARRNVVAGLALFLAVSVLTPGSLQAAPVPRPQGGHSARSAGVLASLWGDLQRLLQSCIQASPAAATQRAALPKEGPAVDPNGSPRPPVPPPLPSSVPQAVASMLGGGRP